MARLPLKPGKNSNLFMTENCGKDINLAKFNPPSAGTSLYQNGIMCIANGFFYFLISTAHRFFCQFSIKHKSLLRTYQ